MVRKAERCEAATTPGSVVCFAACGTRTGRLSPGNVALYAARQVLRWCAGTAATQVSRRVNVAKTQQ